MLGGTVGNISEFYQLLQLLHSKSVDVTVDLPDEDHHLPPIEGVQLDQALWKTSYSHIKNLTITRYVPNSVEEVQFFVDEFQHLHFLTIYQGFKCNDSPRSKLTGFCTMALFLPFLTFYSPFQNLPGALVLV